MSNSKIETSTFSATTAEQRESPILRETKHHDDVFRATRRLSNSEMNTSQNLADETYYSTLNQHGFIHLDPSQRSSSSNVIDQLVSSQYHRAGSTDLTHYPINQDLNQQYQRTSSTDLTHYPINQDLNQQYRRTSSTDLTHYPINQDLNPEHIRRGNSDRVTYRQDVAIRYLQPPTPPPSGPVIIREIRAPGPPEAPPLVIRQRQPAPATPPPVIIRERPPVPPPIEPSRVINKYLPAPPPAARKVIIERQAPLPQKPQPVIIEKWLPYRAAPERRVVVEHAAPLIARPAQKNTIITWDAPRVDLVKNFRDLGTVRADPQSYFAQYGSQLATSEYVLNTMAKYGVGNNYAQMMQIHTQPHASLMTNNNHNHASISYDDTSVADLHRSLGDNSYGYVEEHINETILPDGRRQFHSSISSSDEQELLRQAALSS